MNVFDLLKKRGYIYQTSNDEGIKELLSKPTTIYQGFDPSADSFHAGHIMHLVAYKHLLNAGHKIIFLLGGVTGVIGDPTGKTKSRDLLSESKVRENIEALEKQARKLLGTDSRIILLNNADWLGESLLFDYLRNITPYISVNQLLNHETYKKRLAKKQNLSLLEFLYSSLQAWDFLHLFEEHDCRLQIGGQDQWVNILDGVGLVRKARGTEVFAMTAPLLTVSGKKMGKSEKGAVWLDPSKTSPYEFYQYWVNTPDKDLERNLKLFTLLDLKEIARVMKNPPREVQHFLAFEVTKFVHGAEAAEQARQDIPTERVTRADITKKLTIVQILVRSKLASSKSEARRLIEQGGIKLNGQKITDPEAKIGKKDFNIANTATIQVGKRKIVKLVVKNGNL